MHSSFAMGWWDDIQRRRQLQRLREPEFRFMWDAPPKSEWVSLDCETTGLNPRTDEIVSIGAVRIVGNTVRSSERLDLIIRPEGAVSPDSVRIHRLRAQDLSAGLTAAEAVWRLLHFIGSRPLVGYYLEFDLAMLNRVVRPLLGVKLPQQAIEVSALYYDYKFRQLPPFKQHDNADIDLRFATILADLDLPQRDAHDALNDAVMAALAFIKLRQWGAA